MVRPEWLKCLCSPTVDITWDNGEVVEAVLTPDYDIVMEVNANGKTSKLDLKAGKPFLINRD